MEQIDEAIRKIDNVPEADVGKIEVTIEGGEGENPFNELLRDDKNDGETLRAKDLRPKFVVK